MDYERKYNEALKKAKDMLSYKEVRQEDIEYLFPELKENGNERIWKHWKDGIAGNGEGKLVYLVKSGNTYMLSSSLGFECDYIELSELDKLLSQEKQGGWFRIGSYWNSATLDVTSKLWENLVANIDKFDYTQKEKEQIIKDGII